MPKVAIDTISISFSLEWSNILLLVENNETVKIPIIRITGEKKPENQLLYDGSIEQIKGSKNRAPKTAVTKQATINLISV